ncbi:MAG: hypothetical protein M1499_07860, partial [Firmicutes bacterium]|nr:hypothetical protein [Bacillota bacterium]
MYPKKMRFFIGATSLIALGVFADEVHSLSGLNIGFAIMALITLLSSIYALEMIRGHGLVSFQLPALVASSIMLGPARAALIALLFTFNGKELRGQVKWPSLVFNRAQFIIIVGVSSWVFTSFGGFGTWLKIEGINIPVILSSLIAFILNVSFVNIAIALRQNRSLLESLRVYMQWALPSVSLLIPIAYFMAAVYHYSGVWLELFFLIPLAGVRWTVVLVKALRQAYFNTIRVMLAALDAKDPYTYGHSMRVGHYGMLLAQHMEMPEDKVEGVRFAG